MTVMRYFQMKSEYFDWRELDGSFQPVLSLIGPHISFEDFNFLRFATDAANTDNLLFGGSNTIMDQC